VDERKAWLIMVGALALSMATYVAVGWFVVRGQARPAASDRPVSPAVLGVGFLIAGGAAAVARIASARSSSPGRFRALSLLALVILEGGAVVGLVFTILSRQMEPVLVLAATGLAAIAAFVVPPGLAYFRGREGRPPEAPPLGPS
jgi:hypothetical protein